MIGVGIDLVFIPRVARLFNKYGIRFAKKFLHPEELKHFHEQKSDVSLSHYLASR
jgi:phosphopantetheinyl transferase (holo-ACP synthase)